MIWIARLPRRGIAVLAAVSFFSCSNGSSGGGGGTESVIGEPSSLRADPVRERVYVAEPAQGRVLAVDSRSGAKVAETSTLGEPGGIAIDDAGETLYVSVPARRVIRLLDAETLALRVDVGIDARAGALEWRGGDSLLAASDSGLLEIDLADGSRRVALIEAREQALLVQDEARTRAWAAQDFGGSIGVWLLAPDLDDGPFSSRTHVILGPRQGPVSGLQLAFDERRLFVAAEGEDTVDVLDAETLEPMGRIDLPDGPSALVTNAPRTRFFVATGGATAEGLDARELDEFDTILAPAGITRLGMVTDSRSSRLILHASDSSLHVFDLFEGELDGGPFATLGTDYAVEITGEPDEPFVLWAAPDPGVYFLDPAGEPQRRFLDLDPASATAILAGVLDATGRFATTFPVEGGAGSRVLVQAVLLGEAGGGLRAVTNPLVIRVEP